jgi:cell division inhibitor SepF
MAAGGSSGRQVLVLTPRSFHDARTVIEAVRDNRTVLVNSAWLEDSPGQRLIDFVCGGIAAICGQVHRIAEEVFLFAPASVRVHAAREGAMGSLES